MSAREETIREVMRRNADALRNYIAELRREIAELRAALEDTDAPE